MRTLTTNLLVASLLLSGGISTMASAQSQTPTKPDAATVKQVLDARYAFMREVFEKNPIALNFAYISWGEDGGWGKLGWTAPKQSTPTP